MKNALYLVAVLLQGRLVLEVGPPGRQPACLGVDVERAVDSAQGVVRVSGRNVVLLKGFNEVAEKGGNRSHLT